MAARAAAIVAGATLLAAADLGFKAGLATPSLFQHERGAAWAALAVALLLACLAAARIDSLPLAVAAGVTAGGVAGNAISWLVYDGTVPDPLFIDVAGGIAFNLADVFVLAGLIGQVAALAAYRVRSARLVR